MVRHYSEREGTHARIVRQSITKDEDEDKDEQKEKVFKKLEKPVNKRQKDELGRHLEYVEKYDLYAWRW